MRKDKKQVIGDEIGDEQIKLFLNFDPVDATSPSLHKLINAYRGLRVADFERFLTFFVEAGYDLDGKDGHGTDFEIGRAHVCTPVTNAHLVCRLRLEKTAETRHTTSNLRRPSL